jgi:predicted enzyme related to lactoylglutathione lyase
MGNPVVHFEVAAQDQKKQQEFYATLFDWHVKYDEQMNYAMVESGGQGGIGGGIGPAQGAYRVTFYVQVPDLQAALTKAESLGGKTVMPPMEMPGVALAQFADPEGNIVGLVRG